MSNEQKLANHIKEFVNKGKQTFNQDFMFAEIKKYDLQQFEPYNYKQVKEICKNNRIKIKKVKTSIQAY